MPSKRFQSGHEVMLTYVKDYSPPVGREPVYHELPDPLLSGHKLGQKLLEDLRHALAQRPLAQKAP